MKEELTVKPLKRVIAYWIVSIFFFTFIPLLTFLNFLVLFNLLPLSFLVKPIYLLPTYLLLLPFFYQKWKREVYIFGKKSLLKKSWFFYEKMKYINLEQVKEVKITKDLLAGLFGIGNLEIILKNNSKIKLEGLFAPEEIKILIS